MSNCVPRSSAYRDENQGGNNDSFLSKHAVFTWALSVLLSFVILIGFMVIGDSDGISMISYCVTNESSCC